jgi:hypothetical protein
MISNVIIARPEIFVNWNGLILKKYLNPRNGWNYSEPHENRGLWKLRFFPSSLPTEEDRQSL